MKQFLLFLMLLMGSSQITWAQITFQGCTSNALGAQNYTLFATGTTNDAGTIRNTFESTPADFAQGCPAGVCEIRIMWNIGAARWEISLDNDGPLGSPDYTTSCLYFNTSPSFPNPPDLTLGSWQDCSGGLCPAAQMTVMSGDVQSSVSSGAPEIDIIGNALSIVDGDVTPSTTDDTDFGSFYTISNDVHTFTIDNTAGTADLDVSTIVVSGAHPGDFTIGGITLPATITSGATTTFTVTFAPSAVGVRNATVTLNNNDADEGAYDFAVQGTGLDPFVVINTNDAGVGSFRQAVINANTVAGFNTISFNIAPGGAQVISMANVDINITESVLIDGTTQPGYAGTPIITLNKLFGLDVIGANNVTIQDFVFSGNGRYIDIVGGSQNILIQRNNFQHANGANDLAILMTGGQNITISNNSFTNSSRAITLNSITSGVSITGDNTFIGGNALALNSTNNQHISNVSAGGANIVFQDGCGVNNQFNPFAITSSNNTLVENLSLIHPTGGGFAINTSNCNTITIQNNTVANFRSAATFGGGTDAQVLNNNFTNTGYVPGGGAWSVHFNGVGAGALPRGIIFQGNTFNGGPYMLRIENMPNQIITDGVATNPLTNIFLPNANGQGTMSEQLRLINTDNIIIDNVNFSRASGIAGIAIWLDNADIVTIQNSTFANLACGMTFVNGTDAIIQNTSFTNVGYGANPYIGSCIALNGLTPNTLTDAVSINNLTFNSCGSGLLLANMTGQIVSDGSIPSSNIVLPTTLMGLNTGGVALRLFNVSNSTVGNIDLSRIPFTNNVALYAESCNTLTVSGLTARNRSMGVFALNSPLIDLSCSFFSGNTYGVFNQTSTVNIQNSNFVCNTTAGLRLFDAGATTDAPNNYWAANNGSTIDGGAGETITSLGTLTNTATFLVAPAPCAPNLSAEISLLGNATPIGDNDVTPDVSDDTDYGNVVICAPAVRTFTIENNGGAALTINSTASSDAAFVISGITTPLVIPAGTSTTFDVTFTPVALGVANATITLNNTDCKEAVYNYALTANVTDGNADIVRANALSFDGTNDLVSVGNIASLNFERTDNFSLEAWIKTTANGYNFIASKQNVAASNYSGYGFFTSNGDLDFQLINTYPTNYIWVSATGLSVNDGEWHHVAVVYNGNSDESGITFYMDGIQRSHSVIGNTLSASIATSALFNIASRTTPELLMNGQIDEVRVWNKSLTEQDVRENMHLTLGGCETGLAAYYQMNEGAGLTVADKSGNGNDGTLTNGPTWTASGVNVGNDAAGNSNSQTITTAAGASTQNFATANATMQFFSHSGAEDITVTYQEFTPNAITGADGINIIQNPMWTVNKSTTTETMLVDYTFTFPAATFTSLDPAKYSLYWRPMNAEGNWTKIATANAITATTATFGKISLTGQFMVVQESDVLVSDVRGNMYTFDGGEFIDHSATASGLPQGNAPRTMEAWVKTTQGSLGNIVSWGRRSNNMRNSMAVRSNVLGFVGESNDFNGVTPINDGQWHHVAITHDGTTMRLYVDGQLDASSNRTFNTTDQNLRLATISMPSSGENYIGSLDEVRIWNIALTQNQLRENMHLTLKGNEPGLVSYFQFNNDDAVGTAAGVKDAVGGSDGTCTNMETADYTASEVAVAGGAVDRVTIPAGAGTTNFPNTGVSMTFGATSPDGELVISRLETEKPHGYQSLSGDCDNEYFVVRNYGANPSFTVLDDITFNRMNYISPTDVGQPQATSPLTLHKRASNAFGATWGANLGGQGADAASAGTNGMISFNNNNPITTFSQIVVVNIGPNSDLPVELLHFNAKRSDANHVQLDWATATETNNKGFFVERMLENETSFEAITFVDGQGTTVNTTYYDQIDQNSYTGVSYYRLKQVDFDGTISYSNIIAVAGNGDKNTTVDVAIYPNPVYDEFNIRFNELPADANAATIKIISSNGQVLHESKTSIQSFQVLEIEHIQQLVPAMYMLSIEMNNGENIFQKFIKQ